MVDGSWSMGDGMKERPILMTPDNAQKCHEGTKTQTRRIVKPQPLRMSWFEHQQGWCARVREDTGSAEHPAYVMVPCPYGVVWDRLWVRERIASCRACQFTIYKGAALQHCPSCDHTVSDAKWRPSIHMPRWACRTVLEITNIRVERLQEISEEDAIAEGVTCLGGVNGTYDRDDFSGCWTNYSSTETAAYWNSPIDSYHSLWDSINGVGSWMLNPWVWVLTFRKVG